MKMLSRVLAGVRIPPSAKWDVLLLPLVFAFNCFALSPWAELRQAPVKPWLLLPWGYGLVILIPLIW